MEDRATRLQVYQGLDQGPVAEVKIEGKDVLGRQPHIEKVLYQTDFITDRPSESFL